jgi:hypothetical protein
VVVDLRKRPVKMNLHLQFIDCAHIFISSGANMLRTISKKIGSIIKNRFCTSDVQEQLKNMLVNWMV